MATKIEFATAKALEGETPKGATITFRVIFLLTTAISAWLAATNVVGDAFKVEAILILKVLDTVVWGLTRLFGIVIERE